MKIMVTHRHFFAKKFKYIIQAEAARRVASKTQAERSSPETASATGRHTFAWRVTSLLRRRGGLSPVQEECASEDGWFRQRETESRKLRTDMIRRMDEPPRRVDPSGWVTEGVMTPQKRSSNKVGGGGGEEKDQVPGQPPSSVLDELPIHLSSSPEAMDERTQTQDGVQIPPDAYVFILC